MAERAAQFSPFAALAGYEEAVRETGRVVEQRVELSEEEKAVLDRKQQILLAALERGEQPEVTITCFQPDRKKDGGEYMSVSGAIKRVKAAEKVMVFADGAEVLLENILEISSVLFQEYFDH